MTDAADIASETLEACLADAERRARGKSGPESHPDFDGETCVDCGDELPTARLKLGRVRCVLCQTRIEATVARAKINIVVSE